MSYHDIYTENRTLTGHKFSDKTDYLRSDDEFSLNVKVFIGFDDFIILKKFGEENVEFDTYTERLLEGESSVYCAKRFLSHELSIEVDTNKLKIFATRIKNNDIIDYWVYRAAVDFEKILEENDDLVVVKKDVFEQMLEQDDFKDYFTDSEINSIFDIKIKPAQRPLIFKSNKY